MHLGLQAILTTEKMPDDKFEADAFRSTFTVLIQDIKEDLKTVKNDINDLKVSVQFTQAKFDDIIQKTSFDSISCNQSVAYPRGRNGGGGSGPPTFQKVGP